MTQPSRVIYLPPGVVAGPATAPAQPHAPVPSGVPFDRTFFEQVLPQSIGAFCSQVECESPLVEVLTADGATHIVKGISGVSDAWVALHTVDPEHESAIQVFIPYQTIFRVAVHPSDDRRRHLGFFVEPAVEPAPGKA
ncbi:MAG: hypothetical protein ACKVT1_06755 [Dehalococcoidia bacterium]